MPERWRDELARLERYDAPAGVVEEARSRPPVPDDEGPSRRSRVTAGVVAFALFALAASFAWQAFNGEAVPTRPTGDGLPTFAVAFISNGTIDPHTQRVDTVIRYGDAVEESFTSTGAVDDAAVDWVGADDITAFVPGPAAGSPVTLESDGDEEQVLIGAPEDWPSFDRFQPIDRLPETPGHYVVILRAEYPSGTAFTARRIQIVEPGALQLVMTEGGELGAAEASAFVDGHEVEGFLSTSSFHRSDVITTSATRVPDFEGATPLEVEQGAPLLVATPADAVRASFAETYSDVADAVHLDTDIQAEGVTVLPAPGRYLLAVDARWQHGQVGWSSDGTRETARFFFPIEVTGPAVDDVDPVESPSPSPSLTPAPIEVTSPGPGATVSSPVTVAGNADVFEAVVTIWIMDATNNRIAETTTLASCGTGCRGTFTVDIPYSVGTTQPGEIRVFEVSAADGRPQHTVTIPVTLTATDDPIASALEGTWFGPDGEEVPDGLPGGEPLGVHLYEGADHCGWTSVTFLSVGLWPLDPATGVETYRQYVRDPQGRFADRPGEPFESNATLPATAEPSGYHRGDWEIWIDASDDTAIYVVNGDPTADGYAERWPRIDPAVACD